MGMNREDAYYEPEDYDDRSDEIEERTWELMKPGQQYDPKKYNAICEALEGLSVDEANALQAAIDTGDYAIIGRKVMMMAFDYMEGFAKQKAEYEID